ncbi:hypothetical protein L2E82_25827 [Cichorium intybus]|uniref:Uncharacterized protein n=1 Tax=Cichorium intybus TaxID=13427 RepID=A0ACB9E4K2_CICIN|nr:hypothetical protein L2E82_25827 [Cichorium intybus]
MITQSHIYMFVMFIVLFFMVLGITCCTSWCERLGLVQDIETRRSPPFGPPTTTHHHVVTTSGAGHNGDLGEIVKEQIFDSSTCKNNECTICIEEFKEKEKGSYAFVTLTC